MGRTGRRSHMRRHLAASALALIVAACGSDGAETPGTTAPPQATSPSSTTPDPLEPVALSASFGVERSPIDPAAPVADLVAGFNNAGFELWRTQPATDNTVFSPASIGHALLMARAAADEATGAAIDAAFALPVGMSAHQAWNAIDQQLRQTGSDDVTVTIADRIWPRIGLQPDQAWIDLLATEHGADVETLDFAGDPEGSRNLINDWVGEQTQQLIPELLPSGSIDPNTLLVLTDAVYFEARWQTPFGKYDPQDGTFTKLDGTELPVTLMRELELADRRGVGEGFAAAEIPYAGNDYAMLVIVPDHSRFEEIRGGLDQTFLDEIDTTFTTGPYELLLPQWDDASQLDLLAWLSDIGAAPGSYPAIDPAAFLGAAVHAADITVDDQGTVAAAATALFFPRSGPPQPELTIAADRPFLYLIRHRDSGLILFAGQVTDPS